MEDNKAVESSSEPKYKDLTSESVDVGPLGDPNSPMSPNQPRYREVVPVEPGLVSPLQTTDAQLSKKPSKEIERPNKPGLWSKMKSMVMTDTTERYFVDIYDLLKELMKDLPFAPIDITLAFLVLNAHEKPIRVTTGNLLEDPRLLDHANHAMRYACATYGWKLAYGYQFKQATSGLVQGFRMEDKLNRKILMDTTGVKEEDIIMEKWTTTVCTDFFIPGHVMVVDHKRSAIVIAFRGTFHFRDALTDLVARYEKYKEGTVHAGMLAAANAVFQNMKETLIQLFEKHPLYKVIVTGHSLGAGVASLFTIIFKEVFSTPVHCFAFATPCVLSLDLAKSCKTFISTFIVKDDLVPRLSFGSVEDLKAKLQHLLSQDNGKLQRLFQLVSVGNTLGTSLTSKLSNMLSVSAVPDLNFTSEMKDRLYPPGTVYHIISSVDVADAKREGAPIQNVEPIRGSVIGGPMVSTEIDLERDESVKNVDTQAVDTTVTEGDLNQIVEDVKNVDIDDPKAEEETKPVTGVDKPPTTTSQSTPTTTSQSNSPPPATKPTEKKSGWSFFGKSSPKPARPPPPPKPFDVLERSDPSLFYNIIISKTMLTDHFPDVYESALIKIQERLLEKQGKKMDTKTTKEVAQEATVDVPKEVINELLTNQ